MKYTSIIRFFSKRFHRRRRLERRWRIGLGWAAALVIGLVSLIVHWEQGALDFRYIRPHESEVAAINTALNRESERLQAAAEQVATDPEIRRLIADNNSVALQPILATWESSLHVSGVAALNSDGVALLRTGSTENRGDVVFQSMAWGRQIAEGQPVATVERGTGYPLILIGAVPIFDGTTVVGGIAIVDFMNDDFLRQQLLPHLSSGALVASYAQDVGLLSASTDQQSQRLGLRSFLEPGSDWVTTDIDHDIITLNGQRYATAKIVFHGLELPVGGLSIFFPFRQILRTMVLAVFEAVVAMSLTFAIVVSFRRPTKHWWMIVLGSGLFFAFGSTISTTLVPIGRSTEVRQPPFTLYNSTVSMDPLTRVYDQAYDQRVNLTIDSGGEAINAVQAVVTFDPTVVQVSAISLTNSVCTPGLIIEQTIDPTGTVKLACGIVPPGYNKSGGIIATLTLHPLKAGHANLHYAEATSVLANDGLGTNVLRTTTDGSYVFLSTAKADPPSIALSSSTNPNPGQWYRSRDVRFAWTSKSAVRYLFDREQNTVPVVPVATTAQRLAVHAPSDGLFYFHLQPASSNQASSTIHFPVRIDTAPPTGVKIQLSSSSIGRGEILRVHLQGQDALSGLQRSYYLRVDKGVFLPVGTDLSLSFDKAGTHTLTLRAFDRAGNYADAKTSVSVTKAKKS